MLNVYKIVKKFWLFSQSPTIISFLSALEFDRKVIV